MLLLFVILSIALFAGAFAVLFLRLASRVDAEFNPAEWFETFSVETYAPMQRLLDREDFDFLAAQPGYRPAIGRRLLAERRAVFAGYLSLLTRDFNQLLGIAKLMLVYGADDRPEFAQGLWRQQVQFYYTVSIMRVRLAFFPLGLRSADADRLVAATAAMWNRIPQTGFQPV